MMRVLVVGAGIAGLTLARLLERYGAEVHVVERRQRRFDVGYGLALWPHGSRVLHALGLHEQFTARSEPMRRYTALDGDGRVLISSPLPESIRRFGHIGVIPRGDLLELLMAGMDDRIRWGSGVSRLDEAGDEVVAELTDGTTRTVDVVVGADGIGSQIRRLLHGVVPPFDTGWGCCVWWADPGLTATGETTERWGAGAFLGTYPCRDRLCVIAGTPTDRLGGDGRDRERVLTELMATMGLDDPRWLADVPDVDDLFVWPMADVRAPRWVDGRIALVGDAAAAFLPTAGIGASMALESAAALADELSRSDAEHAPQALALYERRRRRRVEKAQAQSRRLARMMFVRSRPLSTARNRLASHASMEQLVSPLIRTLEVPI